MSEEMAENTNDAVETDFQDVGEQLYDHETSADPSEERSDDLESEGEVSEEDEQEEGPEASDDEGTETEEKATKEVEYNLELKDDLGVDVSLVDKIESYAKARGLSNEEAQELLDSQSSAIVEYRQALIEDGKRVTAKEKELFENDPDFGRGNLAQSEEFERQAVNRFVSQDDMQVLKEMGVADTAGFRRVMTRIGRAMQGDGLEKGKETIKPKSTAEVLYGEQ